MNPAGYRPANAVGGGEGHVELKAAIVCAPAMLVLESVRVRGGMAAARTYRRLFASCRYAGDDEYNAKTKRWALRRAAHDDAYCARRTNAYAAVAAAELSAS